MSSASKVGEIFIAAGDAFNKLGDLTMHLHQHPESQTGKWSDAEIEMLRSLVKNFADGLNRISERIRLRSALQLKATLKKKSLEDVGLPVRPITTVLQPSQPSTSVQTQQNLVKREITLNTLNAFESEVDEDGSIGISWLKF